jgi:hypothetical protein
MSRRVLLRAGLLLGVVLAGALLVPDVRWWLWGHLRGEAFYRGRPTSYWRAEIQALGTGRTKPWLPPAWSGWLRRYYRAGKGRPASPPDPALVPMLLELLRDQDAWVRRCAASMLGNHLEFCPTSNPAVLQALVVGLQDEERDVRCESTRALGSLGPRARPATPALLVALTDREAIVRDAAAEALQQINPRAAAEAGVP